jgi:sulfur carrier protein
MIFVNGAPSPLEQGATLTMALERLGIDPLGRGIAVAVDGEVIPRSAWQAHALGAEARVEVLTAMQGG